MNLRGVSVKAAVEAIAMTGGVHARWSSDLDLTSRPMVQLQLTGVTFGQALDLVMDRANLRYTVVDEKTSWSMRNRN